MRWGIVYAVDGSRADQIVARIRQATAPAPMSVQSYCQGRHTLLSTSRRVWLGLRQTTTYRVSLDPVHNRTLIRCDARYSTLSRYVLTAFFTITAYVWVLGFSSFLTVMSSPIAMTGQALWGPVLGVCLLLVLTMLVTSSGSSRVYQVLDELRRTLRVSGLVLDKDRKLSRPRQAVVGLALLVYLLTISGAAVMLSGTVAPSIVGESPYATAGTLALGVLLALLITGVLLGVLAVRRFGADERLVLVTPAMTSSLALLLVLTGYLAFFMLLGLDREGWSMVLTATDLLASGDDPVVWDTGQRIPRSEVSFAVGQAKAIIATLLGLAMLMWGLAAVLLWRSVSTAHIVAATSVNLKVDQQAGYSRAAASGTGFMAPFRVTLSVVWVLTSVLVVTGSALHVSVGRAALEDLDADSAARPSSVVTTTAYAADVLLELGPRTSQWLSRIFWACSSCALVALYATSIGHYLWRRRQLHKRLQRARGDQITPALRARLEGVASTLAKRTGASRPYIVPHVGTRAHAGAHMCGLFFPERYVEVSLGALDALADQELEAIMAHEWSHHVRGHCRWHNVLQLAGRLTLFGGGFVGALQDSFGYELDADRTAVLQFGVRPDALKSALLKMRAQNALLSLCRSRSVQGLAFAEASESAVPGHGQSVQGLTFAGRLVRNARMWLAIYTSEGDISYWHPSIARRLSAIDQLSCKCPTGEMGYPPGREEMGGPDPPCIRPSS